jgi:phosphate transport system substrate-binding protein
MVISAGAFAEADLRFYGSNTVGSKLGPALVKKWLHSKGYTELSEEHESTEHFISASNGSGKSLTVEFDSKGSSTGFRALAGGEADIGMSSRTIKRSEVAKLQKLGHCDSSKCEYVIGLDGIAIIVNPANPLNDLSKAQLKRVFSGEVTDWSEIGGSAGAIKVYSLDSLSGTYDTFKSLVLGKGTPLVAGAVRNASHEFIAEAVASDANAIGFVGLPFINDAKAVAVADGEAHAFKPGRFTVATEDYVLARRLFMYLPEMSASPLAREFIEFAVSDGGQSVVGEVGFVSQEIIAGDIELDETMPKEYRELAAGAHRLSLNFRFLPASVDLDNKAQRDVKRLKAYLAEHKGRLMLFGFADSSESLPIKALQLSVSRADRVADLLANEGMSAMRVRGYGSAVPVASNATEAGRHKNRRVEVWVQ